MLKSFFALLFSFFIYTGYTQVKIGANPTSVNPAAVLELSNDLAISPTTWKSLLPPEVNFSNAAFSSNAVWGIAGAATTGAIVYNIGETYSNGFSGPGLYCWQRNTWSPFNIQVTDKIRISLSTSIAAYDAASVNNWVNVTAAEYNNLLAIVNGAAKYAAPDIYMNTASTSGWASNYTVGGNNNFTKVPASSFIIAWSVRTGSGSTSTSLNSKLKVSASQFSGYTDYGNPLPSIGTIAVNTRVYFVIKTPYIITPASLCYTAVYSASSQFLGLNGSGPEYFVTGDNPNPSNSYFTDSYSQIISTQTKQW